MTLVEEVFEAAQQIVAIVVYEHFTGAEKTLMIHLSERLKLRFKARAFDFLARKSDEIIEVTGIPILQQRIAEHRRQRRRHRHGEPPIDAITFQSCKDFEQ